MKVKTNNDTKDSEDFRQTVERIIEEKIRPSLNSHNGDLYVKDVRDGNVWVVFTGACKTCPAAQLTIEDVVDKTLRDELQEELNEVYLVNEISDELMDFAKNLLSKKRTE